MTPRDDRFPDMPPSVQFDAAIEQALRGDAVGDDVATFARFVDDVRVMADRPPPPPSPALAALLAGSAATREAPSTVVPLRARMRSLQARPTQPTSRPSRSSRLRLRVAAVSIAGKAAVFLAVATFAAAGAAAGILPEPATHFVRRAIEVVTPFELPGEDAARAEHADQRVGHGTAARVDPDPSAASPAASRQLAIASDAGLAPNPDLEANPDSQSEPKAMDDASSWAKADPEPDTSAGPTTPHAPSSAVPPSKGLQKAAPPHAGPPTQPGPKTGHVPSGQASPGTPRPGDPASSGPPLFDPDPSADRPGRPAGTGPPVRPGPSGGSSSKPARERPQHGPPPGVGPGTGFPAEAPPSRPPPASVHGPFAGSGGDRDRGGCRQPRSDEPPPVDCRPRVPDHSGSGHRGDTGSAQAVDPP
jgi:hypothetical protein